MVEDVVDDVVRGRGERRARVRSAPALPGAPVGGQCSLGVGGVAGEAALQFVEEVGLVLPKGRGGGRGSGGFGS